MKKSSPGGEPELSGRAKALSILQAQEDAGNMRQSAPLPERLRLLLALPDYLLPWYDRCARVLPWRRRPSPYRVWVSEIMLQQTRVEAVIPYFERFVAELPDISALARAPEEKLLKLWEGLGYYSRVRNMQKAARLLAAGHENNLPRSFERLRELPGIGEYTAGAIASIAYQLPVPAVDGNVLRVFARLLASRADVTKPAVKEAFRLLSCDMLPPDRPGDFNQALMDLGATICLPHAQPKCAGCPASSLCTGKASGSPETLPVMPPKKPRRVERRTVLALLSPDGVLLRKRPPKGLLGGMWELPNYEGWFSAEEAARQAAELGGKCLRAKQLSPARHLFSHIEWDMQGYAVRTPSFSAPEGYVWAGDISLRGRYALPSAFASFRDELGGLIAGGECPDV